MSEFVERQRKTEDPPIGTLRKNARLLGRKRLAIHATKYLE